MAMETFSAKQLKKMSVNKKTLVIGQHAAPITKNMSDLSEYDILLSSLSNYVEMFKQFTKADYFKLGFANELVLDQISNIKEKEHDVVFIGGIGGPHSEGTKLLEKIAEKFDNFKIWGYGIEKVNENSPIKKCYQGKPLFGKEMYEEIRKSKIILNRHIDISGEYANNMRLYETTGVGSFLITDRKKNLQDLFTPQKEIETYTDSEDLISKIKYYLENPIQREEIALSGQKRTLSEHTYEKRMYELLEIIKKHVN
jgi:spore maturation protein CgeB